MAGEILTAALMIGGVGLFIGVFLGFAGKKFAVEVDEKEVKIRALLPGVNCGACGYSGCDGVAHAIAQGKAPVGACVVGGQKVADEVAGLMGVTAEKEEKKVAFVRCSGDCGKTSDKYDYSGPDQCVMVKFAPAGGPKSCTFGCTGMGDCVRVCEYGAISIQKGIAAVDELKCVDCQECMKACPKGLIIEIPAGRSSHIACVNPQKGKPVMDVCSVGCISCMKCMRDCPAGAITMDGGYPVIDYDKCTDCGTCRKGCPRGCIL